MTTILCEKHRFENIEAVLFDKDGTLANVESYLVALGEARATFIDRLVPGVRDDILSAFGQKDGHIHPAGMMAVGSRAENEIAAAAYVAVSVNDWIAALTLVRDAFDRAAESLPMKVTQTPLLPDVLDLFGRLRANGVAIGLVSSDTHAEVDAFIAHYGLTTDWYCGAGGAMLAKSQAGFLDLACDAMGVMASNVLVVGDSASDIALSNQGSAGFIGLTGGWSTPPLFNFDVATVTHLAQIQTLSV
ncbi:MAG: HAD family hydrolase [Phormidesmis sp.]